MRRGVAFVAAIAAALLVACGGGGDGEAQDPGVLAVRILELGEELGTTVQVRHGSLPADLRDALNPGAGGETPAEDLVALPVHPRGKLLGHFRIERTDGVISYFLFYDVPGTDSEVEQELARQLDETPWQVTGGQSSEEVAVVRFQSTVSSDIDGSAALRPGDADASGEPVTSVVYILEVRPAIPPEETAFQLPRARPVPEDFPASFLLLDGMTPVSVQWAAAPTGKSYRLMLLTEESAIDVAESFRTRLAEEGWELVDDRAVGFATVLDFQEYSGAVLGSLTADQFEADESLTAIFLQIDASSQAGN